MTTTTTTGLCVEEAAETEGLVSCSCRGFGGGRGFHPRCGQL